MTEEQIFELIEKHFQLAPIHDNTYLAWFGETNAFVKFADEIRKRGWLQGYEYATEIHTDEINLLREELKKLGKVL